MLILLLNVADKIENSRGKMFCTFLRNYKLGPLQSSHCECSILHTMFDIILDSKALTIVKLC